MAGSWAALKSLQLSKPAGVRLALAQGRYDQPAPGAAASLYDVGTAPKVQKHSLH
jgi:hypothetical protein